MEKTIKLKNGESILYSTIFHKDISMTTIALNLVSNCISECMAGKPIDTYRVTLTNERVFIEAVDILTLGDKSDVLSSISIPLEDIKSFDIEYKKDKEYIYITNKEDKIFKFTYDINKEIDIPLEMKKIMNK